MRREPLVEAASLVLSQCQCRSLAGTQPHKKCWQLHVSAPEACNLPAVLRSTSAARQRFSAQRHECSSN